MIKARIPAEHPDSRMKSYREARAGFSWTDVEKRFTWHQTGLLNIVKEAIDQWAEKPETRDKQALLIDREKGAQAFTYGQLRERSCQWAGLLKHCGFHKGDRLFLFLPTSPEIYLAMLGCARLGVIFCPLYRTLGYQDLEARIHDARPRGILTHPNMVERLPLESMEAVEHVLYSEGPLPGLFPKETLIPDLLPKMPVSFEPIWLKRDTPLYLIYTSGSTGPPKGVVHGHGDMVGHWLTANLVLDLQEGDTLWTDGDPAWVTGTVYSTFAPWLTGAATVVQCRPFSASTWYQTLEEHGITVWYTTPMTIRRLMDAGKDLPKRYELTSLRHMACVGEALAPELFYWVRENLKHSVHENWWMTETGMICLANFPSLDVKPGSMGLPVPGIEAAILNEEGNPLPLMSVGELALKAPWPAMTTALWEDEARYEAYFRIKGWFLTGDMALQDEEGYFYHQGRMDDMIKVGEKFVGPYDIEQVLYQHPAVYEAAVISKSREATETHLKAFVRVRDDYTPSTRLQQEIKAYVKANLSPDTPLKEIAFLKELPKTRSGKILRRVLRARELGLPEGNVANMEE